MAVSITFNGTIVEDEGDKLAVEPGAEDNNVSSLPSGISFTPTADGVVLPSSSASFPTFAQFNNLVTITGATGTPTALFSDANGVALSGADSGLTTDNGTKIYLYTSPSNPLIAYGIAQTSPGSISSGTLVFAVMLQTTTDTGGNLNGGNFFIEQYQAIKNPVTNAVDDNDIVSLTAGSLFVSVRQDLTFSDFSKVPSGNDLWAGIQPTGSTNPNAPDLLVTGIIPNATSPSAGDEVNVSSTGLGADGQQLKHGVGLRIDFVNNVTEPETTTSVKDPNALSYSSRQNGTGAGWSPVQANPTNSLISAQMVAYEVTGTQTQTSYFTQINNNNPGGQPDSTQTTAVIHSVTVADASGHVIGSANNPHPTSGTATVNITSGNNAISVTFDSAGTATVNNILTNYLVTFSTETAMDRFTVTNVSAKNNVSFDVGNIHALGVSSSQADAGLKVNFEDAGPTLTASATGEPTLTTTDPVAPSTSTAAGAFAGQFTANFGADGAASSGATSYSLSTAGGTSGLTDTFTGQTVVLSQDATGNIVGKDTSGDTVFTVSVDSTGKVTLTQLRAVVQHSANDAPNNDAGEKVGLSGTNLVVLSDTITDGDGDTATASLDLTPQLFFKDVGPSITASTTGEPTLTTTDTTSANPTTATGAFASQFTVNYNADGPAASSPNTYALSTSGNSGLTDTVSGQAVVLSLVGGQIVGTAGAGGPTVFAVSVDGSGKVTLTQDRAVVQPFGTNPDKGETVSLGPSGSKDVVLSETITDGDGDIATASLDLTPQLLFQDVGPSITASTTGEPTLMTTDVLAGATPSTASAGFAAQFTPSYNADGPASNPETFALSTPGGASGLTDTQTGQSVVLSLVNGQIVGKTAGSGATVFTVSVDSSGNVTLTQSRAVKQPTASSPDTGETVGLTGANLVVLSATATDGDGDSATASLDLTPKLLFADTGPSFTATIGDSTVNFATDSTGTATQSLNGNIGADFVPNAVAYTIVSEPSSLTINGVLLKPVLSADQSTVTYYQDTNNDGTFGDAGDTAFYKLQLSEPGATPSAGSYTFTVLSPPPPNVLSFNLSTLASGQNLWGLATDASGNNGFVVFANDATLKSDGTEASGGTINTSKGQSFPTVIGISNNQFDASEGAYVTFVNTPPLSAGGSNNANGINYGGFLEATDAETTITKVTGATKTTGAEVSVQAYDRSQPTRSDQPNEGKDLINQTIAGTNSTNVAISSITITDSAGNDETNKNGRSFTISNGIADIKGLLSGDTFEWKTSSNSDQVQIKDVAGTFDIGAVSIIQHQSTPAQKLPFTVQATDGDGDFQQASFNVNINGLAATS